MTAKGWPSQPLPPGWDKVVEDNTPTLLVNGNLDTITPLRYVRSELLPSLPNGHLVVLEDQSHEDWASQQLPALNRLVSGFLANGKVDASGYVVQPPPFR